MDPVYFGVDVAGAGNTWMCALRGHGNGAAIALEPRTMALSDITAVCEQLNVVALAIDAQLTIALSEDNGFRTSDLERRSLLPRECESWVASINSLMAVPIRGQLLAETLSPVVGTILETHPRACLLFGLGGKHLDDIKSYKRGGAAVASVQRLWNAWCARYAIGAGWS